MHVIFPMAGEGSRFGYTFKPFLRAGNETFIQMAKKPFDFINPKFVFVFREIQEKRWNVTETLRSMFPEDDLTFCLIESSKGALDTAKQAVDKLSLTGPAFVCDCDHSIDVTPMMSLLGTSFDAAIPTWYIEPKEYAHWGKVVVGPYIRSFHEKEIPEINEGQTVMGTIGCHLISKIEDLVPGIPDFSTMFRQWLPTKKLVTVKIHKASFFGTPKLLEDYRLGLTHKYTIFMDIDGTIVDQETKAILPYSVETINKWRKQGHKVILTTASTTHTGTGIPHDGFISGLSPGPRIVINDRKPYLPFYTVADGHMVSRNQGIQDIDLDTYRPPRIVKELKGGSGDKIYIIEGKRVRKYSTNCLTLRRQYEDMQRLSYLVPDLFPKVLGSRETTTDYYYDMEYLEGFRPLWTFSDAIRKHVSGRVIQRLTDDLYCFRRPIKNPIGWLETYLETKVYPRIDPGDPLMKMFSEIEIDIFAPKYESPIHGDLTHENILYNPDNGLYKLIDPAGSNYVDPPELDRGKLLQSSLCLYELWEGIDPSEIPERFLTRDTSGDDVSLFYLVTHLIRMIPYRSESGAKIALALAHFHFGPLYLKYKI